MKITTIISCFLFISQGYIYAAETDTVSGRVLEVVGPERVRVGEKLRNVRIIFENVDRKHNITVSLTDTKFRLCWQGGFDIAPPQKSLKLTIPVDHPIGYRNFIRVDVDGVRQDASHSFVVVYPRKKWVDFYPAVWANYDAGWAPLLRKAGINATTWNGEDTVASDFAFYTTNTCFEVFSYYHKRRDEYRAIKKVWAKHPTTPPDHHRRPCLVSDSVDEMIRYKLQSRVEAARDFTPLFYNVADEIGIADQSAVSNLDWDYPSRDAWTAWLKKTYGSVEALNAEWGSDYPTWDRVRAFFPSTDYMYDRIWRDCLLPESFETVDKFNEQFGTSYASFADIVKGYAAVRSDNESMQLGGLKKRFGNIDNLNKALGVKFDSFTAASKYIADLEGWMSARNAEDTRGWNLSWWCDFRDYMGWYMAEGLRRAVKIGRKYDPDGRFGITGTHHPSPFNGHEYQKLMKVVDFIMPYNIGKSFELMRGLDPHFCYMNPTWQTGKKLQRDIWYHFLHGTRGVLFWDNHETKHRFIDRSTGKLTPRALSAAPVLKEITSGTDRMLTESRRDHNGIAIYFSMPSVRVEWFQRNIKQGRRYIYRESWNEYQECERTVLRSSWIKLIEDNHLQFIFVTPEQVAEGRLEREGIRCLVLPEVWAMSDEEAFIIRKFADAGGMVIADQFLGLYDSHGRRREGKGILDDLFGIDQSGVIGEDRTRRASGVGPDPSRVKRRSGAVFLNEDVSYYSRIRMTEPARAEKYIKLLRSVIRADIKPVARVFNADTGKRQYGTEVGVWHAGGGRLHVAIWHNYKVRKEGLGGERYTDNSAFEKPENIEIRLDKEYFVINQRTGEDYGKTSSIKVTLDPWQPTILTLQDKPLLPMKVHDGRNVLIFGAAQDTPAQPAEYRRGQMLTLKISTATDPVGGKQAANRGDCVEIFHVDAYDPGGNEVWYYCKDVDAGKEGVAEYAIPLALNEKPGLWKFTVREVAAHRVMNVVVKVR